MIEGLSFTIRIRKVFGYLLYTCLGAHLPHGKTGQFPVSQTIRRASARLLFDATGEKINIGRKCRLSSHISIDDYSGLGDWSYVSGALEIGKGVMVGPRCVFLGLNHIFDEESLLDVGSTSRPIRINDYAWLGYGVTILSGVTVGEYSIVGAQSVVTHDVPPYSVVAGSPARLIRRRR